MSLPELKIDFSKVQVTNRLSLEQELANENRVMYHTLKRFMDVAGATLGLIIFLPLLIVVAIMIKYEDPKGSVFYKQVRVGKNGRTFNMYKFRSMVSNADELLEGLKHLNDASGAMFKMKEDPRVTRIGKLIRRTSIDELPQFWNVLRGEMSLVGPRPPLLREVVEYTNYDKQRLLVKPGCTGLWQVSARNSVGFKEMVELDLRYIEERNLLTDITLIIRTFFVMLHSKDAY